MKTLKRAVELSQEIVKNALKYGDTAVDCTAGNGNDTLFLAKCVGQTGRVYCFDIQCLAIQNTTKLLEDNNVIDRVQIINDSHHNIESYIKHNINAAMYNLGYLPGGDHSIVTQPNSTIDSLSKVLDLLAVGGIVTIAIYYGHEGGENEKNAVIEYCSNLDQKKFAVQKIEFINFANYPPILIAIERID